MNTRKYPRTLQEAFGPYTTSSIEDPSGSMDWQDKLIVGVSVVTTVTLLGLIAWGYL